MRELAKVEEKMKAGERLTFEEGIRLFECQDIFALGRMAQQVRRRLNGQNVFYSKNLHLNHTNICSNTCSFCAFVRKSGDLDAYTLTLEEIETRVAGAFEKYRINEVHIVGGHNPDLDLNYYLEMISRIRHRFPGIYLKALSAPEVEDLAKRSGLSIRDLLKKLIAAGLNSLPGGGAEIFSKRVRQEICAEKTTAEDWLAIHRTAHQLGLPTNATMLYGHLETVEERVDHMLRLRALQDETRGFKSFIPLVYKPENNRLKVEAPLGGFLDLKVYAIARLLLDNIPHLKVHWSGMGLKFAPILLAFGADDLGGINLHEKIMHDAGSKAPSVLLEKDLTHLIESSGYESVCVNSSYK